MRELYEKELKVISGAGIVADNPNYQQAMKDFDEGCKEFGKVFPYLTPAVIAANSVVHGVGSLIDTAFTSAYKNIMHLLGE